MSQADRSAGPRIEVAVFGHVQGARLTTTMFGHATHALGLSSRAAHCSYRLVAGERWALVKGVASGASHTDCPASDTGTFVWEHPLDASFVGAAHNGWPRLELEVRTVDAHGRSEIAGYATQHLPSAPGTHSLRCCIWRPRGSFAERASTFFLGNPAQLKDTSVVYGLTSGGHSLSRSNGRERLTSVSDGEVFVTLAITTRELPPRDEEVDPNDPTAAAAQR